jgi:hypothetical protein
VIKVLSWAARGSAERQQQKYTDATKANTNAVKAYENELI